MSKPINFSFNFHIDPNYSKPSLIPPKTVEILKIAGVALTLCAGVATALALNLHALNEIPHLGAICGYSTLGALGITLTLMCVDKVLCQRRTSEMEKIEHMKEQIQEEAPKEVLPRDEKFYSHKNYPNASVYFIKDERDVRIEVFSEKWSSPEQLTERTHLGRRLQEVDGYKFKGFPSRNTINVELLKPTLAIIRNQGLADKLKDGEFCLVKFSHNDSPVYVIVSKLEECDRPEDCYPEEFYYSEREARVGVVSMQRDWRLTYKPEHGYEKK